MHICVTFVFSSDFFEDYGANLTNTTNVTDNEIHKVEGFPDLAQVKVLTVDFTKDEVIGARIRQ